MAIVTSSVKVFLVISTVKHPGGSPNAYSFLWIETALRNCGFSHRQNPKCPKPAPSEKLLLHTGRSAYVLISGPELLVCRDPIRAV